MVSSTVPRQPNHNHHQPTSSFSASTYNPSPAPYASSTATAPLPHRPRAPSSVTSTRSQTRRHRHTRSHQGSGGSSTSHVLPQNEFPIFSQTGDVEILITTADGKRERRYLLHRLILSQCSGVFEAGLRDEWSTSASGSGVAKVPGVTGRDSGIGGCSRGSSLDRGSGGSDGAGKKTWRYVLDWEGAGEDEAPMLVRREGDAQAHGPSLFGGSAQGGDSRTQTTRPKPPPPPSNEGFFRNLTTRSSVHRAPSRNSSNTRSNNDREEENEDDAPGSEILKDYNNLFRTLYQYPPSLSTTNIATAYTESKALLHLADMYDCLTIVGSRVDHHLLRFGTRLLKQIAKYPPSYLKLGYLARSRTIFAEALVHVVGSWPNAAPQLQQGQVESAVLELVLDKVDDLEMLCDAVEARLWRLQLTTHRGERCTPERDLLGWLAVSLFRDWLAEHLSLPVSSAGVSVKAAGQPPRPPIEVRRSEPDGRGNHIASQRTNPAAPTSQPLRTRGQIFLLIGSGANNTYNTTPSYLTPNDQKYFLKLTPDLNTRENLRRFERRVDEVKRLAADIVRPLMRSCLELDLGGGAAGGGVGYLTCIGLGEGEMPWVD